MTNMTTPATLSLLTKIAGLTFRPMTANDFNTWAGAEPGAQIAFGGVELAGALCDVTGSSVLTEGGDDCVAVIISGGHVELSGLDADYAPVSCGFDLQLIG